MPRVATKPVAVEKPIAEIIRGLRRKDDDASVTAYGIVKDAGFDAIAELFRAAPRKALFSITSTRNVTPAMSVPTNVMKHDLSSGYVQFSVLLNPSLAVAADGNELSLQKVPGLLKGKLPDEISVWKESLGHKTTGKRLMTVSASPFSYRRFVAIVGGSAYELRTVSPGHPAASVNAFQLRKGMGVRALCEGVPDITGEREIPRSLVIHHFLRGKVPSFTQPVGLVVVKNGEEAFQLYPQSRLCDGKMMVKQGDEVDVTVNRILAPNIRLIAMTVDSFVSVALRKYHPEVYAELIGNMMEGKIKRGNDFDLGGALLGIAERSGVDAKADVRRLLADIFVETGRIVRRIHDPGNGVHVTLSVGANSVYSQALLGKPAGSNFATEANAHNFEITFDGRVGFAGDYSAAYVLRTDDKAPGTISAPGIPYEVRAWKTSKEGLERAETADIANIVLSTSSSKPLLTAMEWCGFMGKGEMRAHRKAEKELQKGYVGKDAAAERAEYKMNMKLFEYYEFLRAEWSDDVASMLFRGTFTKEWMLLHNQLFTGKFFDDEGKMKRAKRLYFSCIEAAARYGKAMGKEVRKAGNQDDVHRKFAQTDVTKRIKELVLEGYRS